MQMQKEDEQRSLILVLLPTTLFLEVHSFCKHPIKRKVTQSDRNADLHLFSSNGHSLDRIQATRLP